MCQGIEYSIRVKGYLDAQWLDRADQLRFEYQADGSTIISGELPDQPALMGLLLRLHNSGVTLISFYRV